MAGAEEEVAAAAVPFAPLPVGLCQGYDTVMGEGRNTVVTGAFESRGASSSMYYQICQSIEELLEAFQIEQSSTLGLLNVSRVSQKLRFVQSQMVTSTSVSIAIYSQSIEGTETVTHATLNSGIQPPQSSQELREFFMVYGDSYLSARTHGGEYCALYLYHTETREQQSELITELGAAGIFTKGSLDVSLGTRLNNFNSTTRTHVTFGQTLSGIRNQQLPGPDKMIDFALRFPSLPLTASIITHFMATGYEHVPRIGSHFNPIADNRDLIARDRTFTDKLGQLEALRNTISSIKDIYRFYRGYKDNRLDQVETQADTDIEAVVDMIRGYRADPTKRVVQPVFRSLDNGNPLLQYEVAQSPAYGGGGGDPFDGVPDIREYLRQKTRITALQLRTGLVIDQLTVSYNGRRLHHGSTGGGIHNEAVLGVGTFVTSVSGFYGFARGVRLTNAVLTGLTIRLSNTIVVPGSGGVGDDSFEWKVPTNFFVVGFRGRSGWFLDQLQVVCASFKPAVWIR